MNPLDKITEQVAYYVPGSSPVIDKIKRFTLPFFDGVPIYDVVAFFIEELQKDQIAVRARSMAYSFFMAIFPAIIFLFTLLPYIPLEGVYENLMNVLKEFLPNNQLLEFIQTTIDDLVFKRHTALLSFTVLLTLFFSTQGVFSMMDSFNKSHHIYARRNFLQQRLVALKLTLILFLLFIFSAVLIIAGTWLINLLAEWLHIQGGITKVVLNLVRYLIIILLFFLAISFIYYWGPAVRKKWRFVSLGSTVATILSLASSIGFSYYVMKFSSYNKVYGSIGTIIILMIWLYINSFVLLIGFELNSSLYYNKSLKEK